MPGERSGTTDPARTLALLWGTAPPAKRGPRPGLTGTEVVAAGMAIADADGELAKLSMRRVAEHLGVGTMSLYTYVAGRSELVEAMLDIAYGEAVQQLREAAPATWRDGLSRVAKVNWELYLRHPWLLEVFTGRPPLGPNALAKYDLELATIEGIGLSDVEMDAVLTAVSVHVEGVARRKIEAGRTERRTGMTDADWWAATAPVLGELVGPDDFPIAERVGRAAGEAHQSAYDPDHEFGFGLERLLDGVAALIAARTG